MYFHSFSLVWTVQLFVYRSIMSLFMYHQPTVLLFIYWPFVQYFIYRVFVLVPRDGFHRNSSHGIPPMGFLPWNSSHGIPPTGIPLTQDSSHTGFLPNPVWVESYGRNPVCEESCWEESHGRNPVGGIPWLPCTDRTDPTIQSFWTLVHTFIIV